MICIILYDNHKYNRYIYIYNYIYVCNHIKLRKICWSLMTFIWTFNLGVSSPSDSAFALLPLSPSAVSNRGASRSQTQRILPKRGSRCPSSAQPRQSHSGCSPASVDKKRIFGLVGTTALLARKKEILTPDISWPNRKLQNPCEPWDPWACCIEKSRCLQRKSRYLGAMLLIKALAHPEALNVHGYPLVI